ncbi:S26 family signal peptidase [Nguyenibacter vanlangensis]|uniref:S26 family signal peptidase n=1 Tax=Nguyenibacter vanlangensis TaxID=1216886 RepID=A0ABZ3D9L3_9PROT
MTRFGWFFTTYFVVLAIGIAAIVHPRPRLVWNATASAPVGFYWVAASSNSPLHHGDLVLLRPDPASARLFARRGYLPAGVPLLKRIAATAGQLVCERNGVLAIDGVHVADALATDHRGRPLMPWTGCRRLQPGEIFVLMRDVPASLDGRYFGPSPITSVIGRALPLWTRNGQ